MRAVHRTVAAVSAAVIAVTGLAGSRVDTALDPTTAADGRLRFTVVGDIDSNQNSLATLNRIGAIAPDFNIAVGDLSVRETGEEEAWCDLVKARVGQKFPFELVSGNHESNGENGHINDFSACLPNQLPGAVGTYGRRWYVDVPQKDPLVRFVMTSPGLDFGAGTLTYAAGTPDHQWTSDAIDGARAAGIPWVVAGMHKPCVSIGIYTCQAGQDITNLLISKKVDLVLTGHEHMYGRTKQLATGNGCPSVVPGSYNASCVVDADTDVRGGAGTVFVTTGTGGQQLRDVNTADPEAPYFATWSGNNVNPTYGVTSFDLTRSKLSASFERGSGGTFTDSFTIDRTAAPSNQAPTADFTPTCSARACSFDARASSDPDGTIASYAWDFGDGTAGSGATTSRTYTADGTFTVRLTVADDQGATATTTRTVTVDAPGAALAQDGFSRSVTNGFGTAETGGPWTVSGNATRYSVANGAGLMRLAAGSTVDAVLSQVSTRDTDAVTTVSMDKVPAGTTLSTTLVARRSSSGEYQATAIANPDGSVGLRLLRKVGTTTTVLSNTAPTGLTLAPGDKVRMRLRAVGNGSTTVQARLWKVGSTEPTTWQRTATDGTASLQSAGSVAVISYLSTAATNPPITLALDDLLVTRP